MYDELYPQPNVNWYSNGQASSGAPVASFSENPYLKCEYGRPTQTSNSNASFFTNAAAAGFAGLYKNVNSVGGPQPGTNITSQGATVLPSHASHASLSQTGGSASAGLLIVNVDTALDLTPTDYFGAHHYYASAYYVGESQEEIKGRKTLSVKANPSPTNPSKEDCVLHKEIRVPYNSRQQFIMVAVYEADQLGDTFVGQATVPLAESRLASTSPYQLVRDGIQNGTVTMNVQFDTTGAGPATPSGFPAAVSHAAAPSNLPAAVSHAAASPYGPAPPTMASHNQAQMASPPDPIVTNPYASAAASLTAPSLHSAAPPPTASALPEVGLGGSSYGSSYHQPMLGGPSLSTDNMFSFPSRPVSNSYAPPSALGTGGLQAPPPLMSNGLGRMFSGGHGGHQQPVMATPTPSNSYAGGHGGHQQPVMATPTASNAYSSGGFGAAGAYGYGASGGMTSQYTPAPMSSMGSSSRNGSYVPAPMSSMGSMQPYGQSSMPMAYAMPGGMSAAPTAPVASAMQPQSAFAGGQFHFR